MNAPDPKAIAKVRERIEKAAGVKVAGRCCTICAGEIEARARDVEWHGKMKKDADEEWKRMSDRMSDIVKMERLTGRALILSGRTLQELKEVEPYLHEYEGFPQPEVDAAIRALEDVNPILEGVISLTKLRRKAGRKPSGVKKVEGALLMLMGRVGVKKKLAREFTRDLILAYGLEPKYQVRSPGSLQYSPASIARRHARTKRSAK